MEYTALGSTDLSISRISFGCWAIGGHGYGKIDDRESIRAIRKALDLGINLFDTADVYGFGHSEEILGKALGKDRQQVVIATKFGVAWDSTGRVYRDCSAKRINEALEGSLRRLKIDCIPLYQIHWHDGKTSIEEIMTTLENCQKSGKIRYIGCSNFSIKLIQEACKTKKIESNQMLYNLVNRDLEMDMAKCAQVLKISNLTYSVLARGLFSGKYDLYSQFGSNDTRKQDKDFRGKRLKTNLKIIDKLKETAIYYDKTPLQVAIRWVLDNPYVASAIVGIKTIGQLEENTGAVGWKLKSTDRNTLSSLTKQR
jgi:myo-inositol catabolism protein IolS